MDSNTSGELVGLLARIKWKRLSADSTDPGILREMVPAVLSYLIVIPIYLKPAIYLFRDGTADE